VSMPCVCGEFHATECCCGCAIYEPDDGTPTPSSACNPDFNADPYQGIYQSNGKYTI
jgi:hypothetical protein